jgi:hypothetical protein
MGAENQPQNQTKSPEEKRLDQEIVEQMIKLATSGFGLVAALAWNNVIQELVNVYVKPRLAQGSGLISLVIYAVLITVLAVTVTYNLTKLNRTLKKMTDRLAK